MGSLTLSYIRQIHPQVLELGTTGGTGRVRRKRRCKTSSTHVDYPGRHHARYFQRLIAIYQTSWLISILCVHTLKLINIDLIWFLRGRASPPYHHCIFNRANTSQCVKYGCIISTSLPHTTTGEGIYRNPVCSSHVKPSTGGPVVRWVTTRESPLLYVFYFLQEHVSSKFLCSWIHTINTVTSLCRIITILTLREHELSFGHSH